MIDNTNENYAISQLLSSLLLVISYELSDGQSRQEKGSFRDGKDANGSDIKVLSVTGSYSFQTPDGATFQVTYTADEVI